MKRLMIAIFPLTLLLIVVGAQRISTRPEHGTVISLGEISDFNCEQSTMTAMVTYLRNHPHSPITVTWREELAGCGITERRATYTPDSQQLVFVCINQRDTQTGITISGMKKALEQGNRGATFADAKIASTLPADKMEWIAVDKSVRNTVSPYF